MMLDLGAPVGEEVGEALGFIPSLVHVSETTDHDQHAEQDRQAAEGLPAALSPAAPAMVDVPVPARRGDLDELDGAAVALLLHPTGPELP